MHSNTVYFYTDKPILGLDIGYSTAKVMQIGQHPSGKHQVLGYGVTPFDPKSISNGVITDYEALAAPIHALFSNNIVGQLTTRRVNVAAPASRTFTRVMSFPVLEQKDLADAVRLEAEQYIPIPIDELYVDYSVVSQTEKGMEVLAVAVPKKVVDSYVTLCKVLDLELVSIETSTSASSRLFLQSEQSDIPAVLIDLGSLSADITIYDGGLVITGTVPCGGDSFTATIADTLKVSRQEAHIIKTKYGLGLSKKQSEITAGLKPLIDQMLKEVRRMIRYYEERSGTQKRITQIITMGGGANMPGLSDYMTNSLRLAVRMCDPWQNLSFHGLQPPNRVEKSLYITVAGLALVSPKELF